MGFAFPSFCMEKRGYGYGDVQNAYPAVCRVSRGSSQVVYGDVRLILMEGYKVGEK